VTIILSWLLADFIAGVVHWFEDKVLLNPSRYRFINAIRLDNELHHTFPAAMLKLTPAENIRESVLIAWPLAALLFLLGAPTVIWLALFFVAFGNLIHRFAHQPRGRVGTVVRLLQKTGLFISTEHHLRHHFNSKGLIAKEKTTIHYCPMTNWLNPILDKVGFFAFLERLFL
jgi:hypothetical protein